MMSPLHTVWEYFLGPILRRPLHLQMAALCHRGEGESKEYLLVTSRTTKRWIIPKGWPIPGLDAHETALQEAWEEAGVRGSNLKEQPIGSFNYQKRRATGMEIPIKTLVYAVEVEELAEEFPESDERTRKWVDADTAAELVNDAGLKTIFRDQ